MPRETSLEIKVGIFVAAAIVCLVAFIFSISDFSIFKRGDHYRVVFHYAGGLKKGAPVRLAGVDVGYVRDIRVMYAPKAVSAEDINAVAVNIWVESGHHLSIDSKFSINQLGLLGEKYLEVIPGISFEAFPSGATMRGEDPVSVGDVLKMVGAFGSKLEETLTRINQGILTPENQAALAKTLSGMADITDNIRSGVLSESNKVSLAAVLTNLAVITDGVKKGEGTVGKLLTDASVFRNLDELSADLKANPWKLLYRPKKAGR